MQAHQLLQEARCKLQAHTPRASFEAQEILAYVLSIKPKEVLLLDGVIPQDACQKFRQCIARRCQDVPLDYIIQQADFWKYRFQVEQHALAPRQETELMIEAMLEFYPKQSQLQLADIGCGTGVIGISLALEFPNSHIWASDVDERNTALCRKNADNLGVTNIQCHTSNLLEASSCLFDVILSNPPYVESHLLAGLHDPKLALDGGSDGLEVITQLIIQSVSHLKAGGRIFIEHGNNQALRVAALLKKSGFIAITTLKDMYTQPRITYGTLIQR